MAYCRGGTIRTGRNCKDEERGDEAGHFSGWAISQRHDKLESDEPRIDPQKHVIYPVRDLRGSKKKKLLGRGKQLYDDHEGEPEVGKSD